MRPVGQNFVLCLFLVFAGACQTEDHGSSSGAKETASSSTAAYIPFDLNDALRELDQIMGEKGRSEVLNAKEDDMILYHFGVGQWMRNEWGLWRGSRLSRYFNQLGIRHADDMSGIILTSYWRKLHEKPIDLEGQVRYYRDYWKEQGLNERD